MAKKGRQATNKWPYQRFTLTSGIGSNGDFDPDTATFDQNRSGTPIFNEY